MVRVDDNLNSGKGILVGNSVLGRRERGDKEKQFRF